MICAPVAAESNHDMARLLEKAASVPADLHEVRFDALKEPPAVEELVAASTRPVVAVCRSTREGGAFAGDDAQRREILLRAAKAGAAYIDAEAVDVPHVCGKIGRAILIASMHDFHGTPDNLVMRIRELSELPADWIKFSVACRRPLDAVRILRGIQAAPKPCIGIGMGEEGLVTRILGPAYGAPLAFGSIEEGRETASGQPTARELAEVFRVGEITQETPVYGLLGDPVAQSRGYLLHNAAFAHLDFDAVYIPFRAASAEEFLNYMPGAVNLHGLSVTIPHKRAALRWAAVRSEAAERIGAANTLTLTEKGWRADNTDLFGVFEPIKSITDATGMNLTNTSALVLGAGGTTRAVGFALSLLGCKITLAARNTEKAWEIAGRMDWDVVEMEEAIHASWKVVANTTPVGMYPNVDATLFPANAWKKDMVAFDAVHNPPRTRFLRDADAAGALTVDGVEMFLRQASGQFRIWTGQEMPRISSLT